MDRAEKIQFFLDMTSCFQRVSYWQFDADFNLLYTTCEQAELVRRTFFVQQGWKEDALRHSEAHNTPLISSSLIGVIWATVFEKQGEELQYVHVLGPVFGSDVSTRHIEQVLDQKCSGVKFRRRLLQMLATLPVLNTLRFYPYVQMLHFCVTGERISFTELSHAQTATEDRKAKPLFEEEEEPDDASHHGVYAAEQELFKMIEDGNINYAHAINNAVSIASLGNAKYQDSRQKHTAVAVTFITLSVRAAIRGGLPPATAYSVGDSYEAAVAECNTMTEIKHILDTMFDDFVHRVHRCKQNPHVSKAVQSCCDYVDMHIYDKIELETLAGMVGYTKYYLTRKFKQELGVSIWDYINGRKVEQAKVLLTNPSYTIQDISDMLNYCTRSYFSEIFQAHTGMWPSDYRAVELKM